MKILAIDQARHGGYAIFNYEKKQLLKYDSFCFTEKNSTFAQETTKIEDFIHNLIKKECISAVFIEEIHMSKNAQTFKKLARLQGVLINLFEKNNYLYSVISPSQWQNFCKAKGRSTKEIKAKIITASASEEKFNKRRSKIMSLEYVKQKFGLSTTDDNIADAICIGDYIVNQVKIY